MALTYPLPWQCFSLIAENRESVLLHTSKCDSCNYRSYLFLNPIRVLVASSPAEFPDLLEGIDDATRSGYFVAGYMPYECGQVFEPQPGVSAEHNEAIAWFGVFKEAFVFNHRSGVFEGSRPPIEDSQPRGDFAISNLRLGISETDYKSKIEAIHDLIRAGDSYQINFTDGLNFDFAGDPAALFASLTRTQPVPYSAFIHQGDRYILSFSPELFFRIENGRIVTRPMKGTASRGRTTEEDERTADWLRNDPKNRAENVMIVDMLRNDIGRICEYGSVRVDDLFSVEKYSTLFQMTSTVSGKLRANAAVRDIFAAMFPSGSVTGAPKVRSMQIIRQLEENPRGIYTGCIGFVGRNGDATFNVAIRTLVLENGRGEMGVGSGITIDSDAQDEFRECELKARFLRDAPTEFAIFESLLWRGGSYPFLSAHLNRMESSAHYFDFPFNRKLAETMLQEHAGSLQPKLSSKVRLELKSSGEFMVSSSPLLGQTGPGIVTVSERRTSSGDRFLFHKTTNRGLYQQVYEQAGRDGYDDALFLNERDELTEGAISNVILQFGEKLYTPSLSCGLLPGVYRQHLLATNPAISECVLTIEDLFRADTVFLCNAVRGIRKVKVIQEIKMVSAEGIKPSTY